MPEQHDYIKIIKVTWLLYEIETYAFYKQFCSEEVFDIKDQMTAVKTQRLKDRYVNALMYTIVLKFLLKNCSMCEQFGMVFDLCQFVLKHSETPSLLQATLGVMISFGF